MALRLGLGKLANQSLNLGDAHGWATTGDKLVTLVVSALAGSDCIDDADASRWYSWRHRLRGQGAIHPGHPPAQLPLGHVLQLDRVSRELLAQAWKAGAGPGEGPLAINLDSTI